MTVSKVIDSQSKISIHFDIRLKDGSIADSTRNVKKPMTFTLGEGVFSEKLERDLLGLKVGDKKKIMLLPDDAFGQPHPASIFQVPKNKFASLQEPLEVGLIIEFGQADGTLRPGIITAITDEEVTVDFNHPLAGQVVLFDIEIVAIH